MQLNLASKTYKIFQEFGYRKRMKCAKKFTQQQKFELDCDLKLFENSDVLARIATEIANGLDEQFRCYEKNGYSLTQRFGGDCGNIHKLIFEFIRQHYPTVPANITIGEIAISDSTYFEFPQKKFIQWTKQKPSVLDCHVWITIGDNHIIDATLGTYINTRVSAVSQFGGIAYGKVNQLEIQEIPGFKHCAPKISKVLHYPTAIGINALYAIAPSG